MPRGKRDDQLAMDLRQRAGRDDQTAIRLARELHNGALDLLGVAHADRSGLHPEQMGHGLNRS
jgi:hypothetical protein